MKVFKLACNGKVSNNTNPSCHQILNIHYSFNMLTCMQYWRRGEPNWLFRV